ncbi:MAG TPA: helicase c2, partial [Spirochaetaceae bacterium]|nr:helicase c2 [Spirochaetaceae bacterium]
MSTAHSAHVEAAQRMTQRIRDELKGAIESAGGNEIFAIGSLDESGLVCEVEIIARGTSGAVPALGPYFEKGSVLIHNHPSGYLQPSDADVAIAAEAGTYGVGSYIVDNDAGEVFIVAEP